MLILIDLDNTVCNFNEKAIEIWNERYPDRKIENPKLEKFRLHHNFPEYKEDMRRIIDEERFYGDLDPIPGSIEAIKEMQAEGHKVVFCSSPLYTNPFSPSEKYEWVKKYFGLEMSNELILSVDKTKVIGDVLIDDHPNIEGDVKPVWKHIVYNQEYNKNTSGPRIDRDWSNWKDALNEAKINREFLPKFIK